MSTAAKNAEPSMLQKVSKTVDPEAKEDIFTSALLKPLYFVVAYLFALKYMAGTLNKEKEEMPYVDPFKSIWFSAPMAFTVIYLLAVYFGPKYMKNREEFQIKPFIFTYNVYQCLLNIWCVYAMVMEIYTNPWFTAPWGNSPQPGPEGFRIAFLVWVHYNNKYIELLDTLFMILRKKDKQLSFLHCYHHILLIWAWYFVCKTEAGGDCYFGAAVNSTIHVIMYGYYTLALLGISCPWKKWITTCQMLQFCLCLSHSIYVVFKGNMPISLPLAQAFVMVNMLVLFGNFYKKSYSKPADKKTA